MPENESEGGISGWKKSYIHFIAVELNEEYIWKLNFKAKYINTLTLKKNRYLQLILHTHPKVTASNQIIYYKPCL